MSIIRIHRKERDFFTVKREALENETLSFKAKGLWAYAMSRKDEWNFHVSHLVKVSKEKHTAIYSAIQELIKAGYCLKERRKKGDGTWEATDYIVFETLTDAEEFKKSLPHSGFPQVDFPHVDNPPLLKNESSDDRCIESPIVPKRGPDPSSKKKPKKEKLEVAQNVFLNSEQQQSLLKRLDNNPDKLKACYEKLSVWKIAKGLTNINDYLNIIRWVIKSVEEDIAKPKPVDREAIDRTLVENIEKKYAGHPDIVFGKNHMEFKFGYGNIPYVKLGDNGFREQVLNYLNKMNLNIEGL